MIYIFYFIIFIIMLTTHQSSLTQTEVNPHIVWDDSLLFFFDAENPKSYPGTGNTWFDLTDNKNDATIVGATFNNNEFQFDGSNDKLSWGSNFSIDVHNGFTFWVVWDLPSQSSGAWNYFLYHNPSGNHKYEFGQYGTGADHFHYKDNISYAGTAANSSMSSTGYSSYAFGTATNGRTSTSVNGANATVRNPGSNSYWATTPTTPMVFDEIFTGAGSYLSANVKMLLLYNRALTNEELAQNNLVANRRK